MTESWCWKMTVSRCCKNDRHLVTGVLGMVRVVGAAAVVSLRGGLEHGQWPDS